MSKPSFKKYDTRFDGWWKKMADEIGKPDALPSDPDFSKIDVFGYFDAGLSPEEFIREALEND